MSSPNEGRRDDDPLVIANQIDVLCDDFESSWKRGEPRRIEDVLREVDESLHDTLLPELLKVDLAYVRRRGESIPSQNYALRFPRHLNLVMRLAEKVSGGERDQEASQWIGGYKLLESVGSGSYGVVWKAWDSDLRRTVAVKVPVDRLIGPEQRELFLREAKSAARLQHPHIVPVYHCGEQEGKVYIVSAFIEGTTLKGWSREEGHTPEEAVSLCIKLAEALDYAHLHGVIHRDLKPSNVLIDRKGEPYITDFGMAKQLDETTTLAPSGTVVGTLAYMPREQALGQSHLIDRRSDVYALGATLYELLTGKPLYKGEPVAVLQQVIHDEPLAPRQINPNLPSDLEVVCLKAIAKERHDRYTSAREFAADLRCVLEHRPVSARRIHLAGKLIRLSKRHRGFTVVLSIAIVAVIATIGMALLVLATGDDGRWNVLVTTEPAGARVVAIPKDPHTLRPTFDKAVHGDSITPVTLRLFPGEYRVLASLPMTNRFHDVERTVPPRNAGIPQGGTNNKVWKAVDDDSIEWPAISIPEEVVSTGMLQVPGTRSYKPMNTPSIAGTSAKYDIPDFLMAPSEFTNAMFLKLRPDVPLIDPIRLADPNAPYRPQSLDFAIHFAEEAGFRLPDEIELEYALSRYFGPSPLTSGLQSSRDDAPRAASTTVNSHSPNSEFVWTTSPPWTYAADGTILATIADPRFHGVARLVPAVRPGGTLLQLKMDSGTSERLILHNILAEPKPSIWLFKSRRLPIDKEGIVHSASTNKSQTKQE